MGYALLKMATLAILMLVCSSYAQMIGGAIWALFTQIFRIPYLGRVFRFLLSDRVKMTVLVKALTWVIGVGGVFWGLLMYNWIFGPNYAYQEAMVMLVVSGIIITNFLYDVAYVELMNFHEVFSMAQSFVSRYIGKEEAAMMESDLALKEKLLLSNLIDTYIPQLLKILTTMGVFYFAASNLNLFAVKSGVTLRPGIYDCLKYAYSLLPIVKVDNSEVAFEGYLWDLSSIFFGIIIFLWTIVFFNLALSKVSSLAQQLSAPESGPKAPVSLEELDKVLGNVFQYFQQFSESILAKLQGLEERMAPVKPGAKKGKAG